MKILLRDLRIEFAVNSDLCLHHFQLVLEYGVVSNTFCIREHLSHVHFALLPLYLNALAMLILLYTFLDDLLNLLLTTAWGFHSFLTRGARFTGIIFRVVENRNPSLETILRLILLLA